MDYSFLNEILLLFVAAVVVVVICLVSRLPTILGYLLIGAMLGPYGFAMVEDTEQTRALAEFGVVFLLFAIGLEFSLPQLIRMRGAVLGLGASQVFLTTAIAALAAYNFGLSVEAALVLGGVIAMSSTALVIKQLTDQVELHSRHGRNAVGILLFQDIMVVPFLILVTSFTSPGESSPGMTLLIALGEGVLALALILSLGRWAIRPLFRAVTRFRSTELFTLTVLLVTLSAAWATHHMGLSLAMGAFFAGMMLGETEFRHQVEAEIRPFRDILMGLFFITVGMLLDVQQLPSILPSVLLVVLILIAVKLVLVTSICRIAGWDGAVALRTGLVLAHGGEFGLAILALALTGELIPTEYGQTILAALVLSMAVAPFLIRFNKQIAAKLIPETDTLSREGIADQVASTAHIYDKHVIVCGYGRVGQNVARFLENESIPYVALDTDPTLVQNALNAKEPVCYGDSANIELLRAAGLERASALVISLNDASTALKILHKVRQENAELPIIVRVSDENDLTEFQDAGATEVIPEAMEASLMLAFHLLVTLNVPVNRVMQKIGNVRKQQYSLLRQVFPGEQEFHFDLQKGDEHLDALMLDSKSWACGHKIADLKLDPEEVIVGAVQRDNERFANPTDDFVLRSGDTIILFGPTLALESLKAKLGSDGAEQ